MSLANVDIHALLLGFLLLGWLLVRLLTEYLFRIEHKPRTWVHRACFVVYRTACELSRFISRFQPHGWLPELPFRLLPLPLCRIGYAFQEDAP